MDVPILSHTLDKVRYFRNVLLSSEGPLVRIILQRDGHGSAEALLAAISDVSDEAANPLCVLHLCNAQAHLPVRRVRSKPPTFLYFRYDWDPFVDALMSEYGDANCEVVVFERDPTL